MASVLIAGLALSAGAQSQRDGFTDLRRDGNGIAALRTTMSFGFTGVTAVDAFKIVASMARLNLTFDARLPGLDSTLAIRPHERTAAAALIEIADAIKLRVKVAADGQLIVVIETTPAPTAIAEAIGRPAVKLSPVRTEATRRERDASIADASIGLTSLSVSEMRASPPFVEPDVLRSVQTLPGVEARSDYAAGFNVRGGESDQNLILLDGYPIYNPFHLGGLFSTFIDPAVGSVSLRTGGLPPEFGGRLSGLLDVHSAEAPDAELHGSGEVSLVSASAGVGRSFADGHGSWMLAARRTYADAVVDLFKRDGFPYHFQDFQGHVTRAFDNGWRISGTAYSGGDVAVGTGGNAAGNGGWGNDVVGVTVDKHVGASNLLRLFPLDSAVIEQRISLTRFGANVDFPNYLYHVADDVHERRLLGSVHAYGAHSTFTIGYEAAEQALFFRGTSPLTSLGDIVPFDSLSQRSRSASLFADELWHPLPQLLIGVGGRFDDVATSRWSGFSPRLSAKYALDAATSVSATAGSYAQWLHSLGRQEEVIEPLEYWVAADSAFPVSRAREVTLGVDRWLSPLRLAHVEAFYKEYDHLLIPNPTSDPAVANDEFLTATGTSYGVDVLVRQFTGGPFSGWMSYSYAVSTRVDANGAHYFPAQDRRHNLNLVGSWQLDEYAVGLRVNAASGYPYTPSVGGYSRERYDPVTQQWAVDFSQSSQAIVGARNSERLPWYARIDLGVSRDAHLRGVPVSPYLSVVNVLNAHNPAAYLYDFGGRPTRGSLPNLPFFPTFGLRVVY
jgi:hypothetical protein